MDKKDETKFEVISASLNQPTINWEQVLSDIISCFSCTNGTISFFGGKNIIIEITITNWHSNFFNS